MNNAPRSNTTDGLRRDAQFATVAPAGDNKCIVRLDSSGRVLNVEVRDANGDLVATAGRMAVQLDDLEAAPVGFREAKFRRFQFRNADDDCKLWQMWILATEPTAVEEE